MVACTLTLINQGELHSDLKPVELNQVNNLEMVDSTKKMVLSLKGLTTQESNESELKEISVQEDCLMTKMRKLQEFQARGSVEKM
jgi:hypothetical protein